MAASLAYYGAFAAAPMLIILTSLPLIFFSSAAIQSYVSQLLGSVIAPQAWEFVEPFLTEAWKPGATLWATLIGIVSLLFASSTLFRYVRWALNNIWHVQPRADNARLVVLNYLFPFLAVLALALLVTASLTLNTIFSLVNRFLIDASRFPVSPSTGKWVNLLVTFAVLTLTFALVFKFVHDAQLAWRDVWVGAALTALLFSAGNWAMSYYLGVGTFSSLYGAAGSLFVFLLWLYYSAQIFLWGGEFIKVYALLYGTHVRPSAHARAIYTAPTHPSLYPSRKLRRGQKNPADPAAEPAAAGRSSSSRLARQVGIPAGLATAGGLAFWLLRRRHKGLPKSRPPSRR
jgi:membrane protein